MDHPTLQHRIEYAAFRCILALSYVLPAEAGVLVRKGADQRFGHGLPAALRFSRFSATRICQHLTLEGWHHLQDAEAQEKGVLFTSSPASYWPCAALALALYRSPVHLVPLPVPNPLLRREQERLFTHFGGLILKPQIAPQVLLQQLANKERIGVPVQGPESASQLTFLAQESGAPVIVCQVSPEPRGRYRITLQPAEKPFLTSIIEQLGPALSIKKGSPPKTLDAKFSAGSAP